MQLIASSIPSSAYNARPFDAHEIDAHPDAIRIWATVADIREAAADDRSDAFDPIGLGDTDDDHAALEAATDDVADHLKDIIATLRATGPADARIATALAKAEAAQARLEDL